MKLSSISLITAALAACSTIAAPIKSGDLYRYSLKDRNNAHATWSEIAMKAEKKLEADPKNGMWRSLMKSGENHANCIKQYRKCEDQDLWSAMDHSHMESAQNKFK